MLGNYFPTVFRIMGTARNSVQIKRNTWILRRVYAPESTPTGSHQRNPADHIDLQKLEVVDFETKRSAGPVKVILLQDIEGIGHQFDVLDVDRKLARTDLLLTNKAVYASPFDLRYYSEMKERMADELAKRIRIPYEYLKIGRELQSIVIPIKVNMNNQWTLNKEIVKASIRLMGIYMLDDSLYLGNDLISGPNFAIESKLIRFYVVVCSQYIVPMLGKITHISVDESKQVLTPESNRFPTEEELKRNGLVHEEPYFSAVEKIDENFPVVDFMFKRANS